MAETFTIAICYDFDGTLSPGNMQEYSFIRSLQQSPKDFWEQASKIAEQQDTDEILAYMYHMCREADKADIKIRKSDFEDFGKCVQFFPGLLPENGEKDWFDRVNAYGARYGATIKHYVISSGIKEMIEGTAIAGKFDRIYASSFIYDRYGVARWPANAVNYTTKMQYLFRINKGKLKLTESINDYMPEAERPVPFERMIYIGDGTTDIPAMKLVKTQNGYSIAVHDGSDADRAVAEKLMNENRVNFVSGADYRDGSELTRQVFRVLHRICAARCVETEGREGNRLSQISDQNLKFKQA